MVGSGNVKDRMPDKCKWASGEIEIGTNSKNINGQPDKVLQLDS